MMHRIQLARKDAGFEVTDRIEVGYVAEGALREAVESNRDEIGAEVLATTIREGIFEGAERTEKLVLDGEAITVCLTRADGRGTT